MLEAWEPHLVSAWRRVRGSTAESPSLTAEERRDVVAGGATVVAG